MTYTAESVRETLKGMADEKYREFTASLIPNCDSILGVRLPQIRKLARTIAKDDWRSFLADGDCVWHEEIMLRGMILGYVNLECEERLAFIDSFIPSIENWAVCDSFCAGLKFAKECRERVWEFLQPCLGSGKEYTIRFAVVMMLDYYIDEAYIGRVLAVLNDVRHDGYYVKMAVAWALSMCFVAFPGETLALLERNRLDDFTYNKTLQKITESRLVDGGTKRKIRSMKRQ